MSDQPTSAQHISAQPRPPHPSRRTSRGDAGEQRLRAAAIHLFAKKGSAAVGIRELASAAGLTSASLYHYVGSKDQLLVDLMRSGLGQLLELDRRAVNSQADPPARLAALMHTHVIAHALAPEMCRVVDTEIRALSGPARAEVVELRDQIEQLWRDVVTEGTAGGWFRSSTPVEITVRALLDMGTGVAWWFQPDGSRSAEELATDLVEVALRCLDARTGTQPAALPSSVDHLPTSVRDLWDLGALLTDHADSAPEASR